MSAISVDLSATDKGCRGEHRSPARYADADSPKAYAYTKLLTTRAGNARPYVIIDMRY